MAEELRAGDTSIGEGFCQPDDHVVAAGLEARDDPEFEKFRRRVEAELRRELREVARVIINRLTQLEFAYFARGDKDKQRISRIRFAEMVATPGALYYRVDTVRMPRGVRTAALEDPEVLRDLSLAVRAPVTTYTHYEHGFWIIVERAEGLASVPRFVRWEEVKQPAAPFAFPLGIGVNKRQYSADLRELPHLLVAGATGYGKSMMLHNILISLLSKNPARLLKVYLADMKGGAELSFYRSLPHVSGFAREPGEAMDILRHLYSEMEKRFQLLERERVTDMGKLNQRAAAAQAWDDQVPYILFICDELANLMLARKHRQEAEDLLANLAAMGRAPGVHLVVATQRPSVDVVTGLIKANFPARVAFHCASQADSRTIIDTGDAAGLGVPGRMVYVREQARRVLQAPYLEHQQILDAIRAIECGGEFRPSAPADGVTLETILKWSVQNGGTLSLDKIYQAFRGQIGYGSLVQMMQGIDGKVVEVNGRKYEVTYKKVDRHSGRRLRPLPLEAASD
jgi:hypothetical protein